MKKMKLKQEKLLIDKYYNLLTDIINDKYFGNMNSDIKITKSFRFTYISVRVSIPTILKKEHFNFLFSLADKYKCELRVVNQEFRFEEN